MLRRASLQFGEPEPDVKYRDRPAAFGVAEKDGRIALARITRDAEPFYALPGGAIDAGESDERAMAREFGEEVGLAVHAVETLTRVDQYARTGDGVAVNNRCIMFAVAIDAYDRRLKIEDNHELVWLEPYEALRTVRFEGHAWAIACWLRRQGAAQHPTARIEQTGPAENLHEAGA
jgi:8-oxo-dGTP diphosphatase